MEIFNRRMTALFVVGLGLFYSPLLLGFNTAETFWGIPIMPLYVFLSWIFIVGGAWLVCRGVGD